MSILRVGMGKASTPIVSDEASSKSEKGFVHAPLELSLPTIRVVQILPGRSWETIKCILKHVPRQRDYHVCLSYMWGHQNSSESIIVNGKRFTVRQNLFDFLKLARKLRTEDWLWIDALCIDQDNIPERNHQVQQMAAIYQQARHVLVYPGPIARIAHFAARLVDMSSPQLDGDIASLGYHIAWRLCQRNCMHLLQMPYWTRTWIVQEIMLAKECFVVSSLGLLPWRCLRSLTRPMTATRHQRYTEPAFLAHLCDWRRIWEPTNNQGSKEGLEFYLKAFSNTTCADVRDRVYGLLGLAYNVGKLQVDYQRSPSMLLLDVLEYCAREDRTPPYHLAVLSDILQPALGVDLRERCRQCAIQYARATGSVPLLCSTGLAEVAFCFSAAERSTNDITPRDNACFQCGGHDDLSLEAVRDLWKKVVNRMNWVESFVLRTTPDELCFVWVEIPASPTPVLASDQPIS